MHKTSTEIQKRIIDAYMEEKPMQQVAREIGVSYGTVRNVLIAHDINIRPHNGGLDKINDGLTNIERYNLRVRDSKFIKSSVASGLSIEEIAKKARLSISRIEEIIKDNTEPDFEGETYPYEGDVKFTNCVCCGDETDCIFTTRTELDQEKSWWCDDCRHRKVMIKKVRGDQLYHISEAIPKALEVMLTELEYQLSEEDFGLALEMLADDLVAIRATALLTSIQLDGCLELVETTIVLKDEEE